MRYSEVIKHLRESDIDDDTCGDIINYIDNIEEEAGILYGKVDSVESDMSDLKRREIKCTEICEIFGIENLNLNRLSLKKRMDIKDKMEEIL